MDITNKVIIVTGGGQGLGRAMAIAFAEKGARLALFDLNQEKLDETAALVEAVGSTAASYIVNVADEAQVETAFAQVVSEFGRLDGLVNNAGITRDGLMIKAKDGEIIKKMSLAQWQSVIDVNLTGSFLCGREAAEQMIKQGDGGVIINISSVSRAGNVGQTNYSAAKAGVSAMVVSWANELGRYGIRTAGVAPGFMMTDMVAAMPPAALEKMAAGIPLKRMGDPAEIAHTCVYIFENDYLTGRVIELDGGIRL